MTASRLSALRLPDPAKSMTSSGSSGPEVGPRGSGGDGASGPRSPRAGRRVSLSPPRAMSTGTRRSARPPDGSRRHRHAPCWLCSPWNRTLPCAESSTHRGPPSDTETQWRNRESAPGRHWRLISRAACRIADRGAIESPDVWREVRNPAFPPFSASALRAPAGRSSSYKTMTATGRYRSTSTAPPSRSPWSALGALEARIEILTISTISATTS